MRNDFAIFILTHGRADNVKTTHTLERCGNTNKIYYIVDNEDDQIDKYKANFGEENVVVFDKLAVSKTIDTMDLSPDRRAIVYARNVSFDIAKKLGLTYFLQLDDDYTRFEFRWGEGDKLKTIFIENIDDVVDMFLDFLEKTSATTVAFAQGGDLLGGVNGTKFQMGLLRKAMNSFFCKVDRPFKFFGRINEDVNTYVKLGSIGKLFFTITSVDLVQTATQANAGGMSGLYYDAGTYVKSFYTIIANPSCVKIAEMGASHKRIHHTVDWERAVPKIISSDFKKI